MGFRKAGAQLMHTYIEVLVLEEDIFREIGILPFLRPLGIHKDGFGRLFFYSFDQVLLCDLELAIYYYVHACDVISLFVEMHVLLYLYFLD